MTVEKQLIDKVESIRTTLNEISVYNLDVKTAIELYYELAKKVNEVIKELSRFEGVVSDEVIKQNEKLIYLLGEGLKEQVAIKIDNLIKDGTIQDLINNKIFNNLNNKIDTFIQEANEQFNTIEQSHISTARPSILCAGVIRNTGTGWQTIEDEGHTNLNITSVGLSSDEMKINVSYPQSSKVGSFIVTPDETLASYGVKCGASVGVRDCNISCYAPLTGFLTGDGIISTCNDTWFKPHITTEKLADNTGFNINYDGVNNKEKVIISQYSEQSISSIKFKGRRRSVNQVEIRAYSDLYAHINYDGAKWNVTTGCVGVNCQWTSDNRLLINHPTSTSVSANHNYRAINITMNTGNSLIHARIYNQTRTSTTIIFYDSQGNQITTPNTNMNFIITMTGFEVPHVLDPNAICYFDIGLSRIRPANLISETGNLWLLGINNK